MDRVRDTRAGRTALRRRRLGLALALLVLAADVVALGLHHRGATGPAHPPAARSTTTTSAPLAAHQYVIDGTVSSLSAGSATGPALATPLLITVPVRGQGSAYLYNVRVDNPPGSTVFWNASEPLSLLGPGGLDVGRVNVTVDGSGTTWYLDGAQRRLLPGRYHVASPVAVGTSGLATSVDGADLRAGATSVLVTSGGATIHRPTGSLHLGGPGALELVGRFRVRSRQGTITATRLELASGAFLVDVGPGPAGLAVHAVVQGSVRLS